MFNNLPPVLRAAFAHALQPGPERAEALAAIKPQQAYKVTVIEHDEGATSRTTYDAIADSSSAAIVHALDKHPNAVAVTAMHSGRLS